MRHKKSVEGNNQRLLQDKISKSLATLEEGKSFWFSNWVWAIDTNGKVINTISDTCHTIDTINDQNRWPNDEMTSSTWWKLINLPSNVIDNSMTNPLVIFGWLFD
jgi:hypothetical protein